MVLLIKKIVAAIFNVLGVSKLYFNKLNRKYNNNYVRVINYHNTEKEYIQLFEKHIKYLNDTFKIITLHEFKEFLNGNVSFNEKPGLLITFDDGYISNYEYGIDVLDKYGIEGTFFISSDKINGDEKYINLKQLKHMIERGHKIGCHTSSHHRFVETDSKEVLEREIIESNGILNKELDMSNDCFCFVGGELPVYTKQAFEMIKDNYNYSFTTLTQVSTPNTNPMLIHRTNVESFWNLGLVKFQVSGLWDLLYKKKAKIVEDKLLK